MLNIGFAFNFNIQRCEIEVGAENEIVQKGYRPLLDLFKKYGIKSNCFVSGYSTEVIREKDPDFIEEIKKSNGKYISLGTYTYTHPIPQLLLKEEFSKQIEIGKQWDKNILDTDTKGFLPPEFAYSNEMANILIDNGIEWFIALASQIELSYDELGIKVDPYLPCKVKVDEKKEIIAVPAAYQLPDTPARFFKLMMKGQLAVDIVIEGIKKFHQEHPNGLLLFKRDAETIFIDEFNSGFDKTKEVMDEFLSKLSKLDFIKSVFIEEMLQNLSSVPEIELPDYLGNTKIETFTEGAAEHIWNLTKEVREKILTAEKNSVNPKIIQEAWRHLLLSHNSDGRIGYWYSKWNPGEHVVAPSRRQFCLDHLKDALSLLE
ncbi:MAG: polysaccharide deacetylase family protein [Pleomorphochaeta sp.]